MRNHFPSKPKRTKALPRQPDGIIYSWSDRGRSQTSNFPIADVVDEGRAKRLEIILQVHGLASGFPTQPAFSRGRGFPATASPHASPSLRDPSPSATPPTRSALPSASESRRPAAPFPPSTCPGPQDPTARSASRALPSPLSPAGPLPLGHAPARLLLPRGFSSRAGFLPSGIRSTQRLQYLGREAFLSQIPATSQFLERLFRRHGFPVFSPCFQIRRISLAAATILRQLEAPQHATGLE